MKLGFIITILCVLSASSLGAEPYSDSGVRKRMLYWEEVRAKVNTSEGANLELELITFIRDREVRLRSLREFIRKREGTLAGMKGEYILLRELKPPRDQRLRSLQVLAVKAGGHYPLEQALGYSTPVPFVRVPMCSVADQRAFLEVLYSAIMNVHRARGEVASYLQMARFIRIQLGEVEVYNSAADVLFPRAADSIPPDLEMLHPLPNEVTTDGSAVVFQVRDLGKSASGVSLSKFQIELDGRDATALFERQHQIDLSPKPTGPRETIEFRARTDLKPGLHRLFVKVQDHFDNVAIYDLSIPIYFELRDEVLQKKLRELDDSSLSLLLEAKPVLAWAVMVGEYNRRTTLKLAAERGLPSTVKRLLDAGVCPASAIMSRPRSELSPWSLPAGVAAGRGHLEVLKLLVENGAGIHSKGQVYIRYAARGKHYETVRYLLSLGVSPVPQDDSRRSSVLHEFAGDPKLLELFLPYFQDVDILNELGLTPVQLAVRDGRVEAARLLLAAGADPRQQTKEGMRLLDLAGEDKASEDMRALLEANR